MVVNFLVFGVKGRITSTPRHRASRSASVHGGGGAGRFHTARRFRHLGGEVEGGLGGEFVDVLSGHSDDLHVRNVGDVVLEFVDLVLVLLDTALRFFEFCSEDGVDLLHLFVDFSELITIVFKSFDFEFVLGCSRPEVSVLPL